MQRLLEFAIVLVSALYVLMHAMQKHIQPILVTMGIFLLAAVFKQRVVFAFAFALLLNYLTFDVLSMESFTGATETKPETKPEMEQETKPEMEPETKPESEDDELESKSNPVEGTFSPNILETLKDAYQNMTPEQIENMTKDTKELMTSQKELMTTLQTMTPIVKEGMKMMEMFNSLKKKN